jgi:four helix bundle protein
VAPGARSRRGHRPAHATVSSIGPGRLAAQLRRSALSIPSNISEGCGKSSRKDTIRYFGIAASSATETESHIEVATALHFIMPGKRDALVGDVQVIQRMLFRPMRNLP